MTAGAVPPPSLRTWDSAADDPRWALLRWPARAKSEVEHKATAATANPSDNRILPAKRYENMTKLVCEKKEGKAENLRIWGKENVQSADSRRHCSVYRGKQAHIMGCTRADKGLSLRKAGAMPFRTSRCCNDKFFVQLNARVEHTACL